MKKVIYAKDIKAIVKRFSLSEEESYYFNDIAESINNEREELCNDMQLILHYGSYSQPKKNAIKALLVYFGAKVQKENDLRMNFNKTSLEVAKTLKCSSYYIRQWFKGISFIKDRFGKFVECSDTYGLNYLEIDLEKAEKE